MAKIENRNLRIRNSNLKKKCRESKRKIRQLARVSIMKLKYLKFELIIFEPCNYFIFIKTIYELTIKTNLPNLQTKQSEELMQTNQILLEKLASNFINFQAYFN